MGKRSGRGAERRMQRVYGDEWLDKWHESVGWEREIGVDERRMY
jgi:hypothetical protein